MTIISIIAIITAYIIKGMCGFANTLIFSSIMSFCDNNINISPTELIIGYPSNIFIALKERKSLNSKIYIPLSILVMCGVIPGTFFLKTTNTKVLKVFFGFVIIFISLEMYLREKQKEKSDCSKLILTLIGILSGILSGLFGIGALLAAYVSRTTFSQNAFKGNLCIVFLFENTFRLILYSFTGIINISVIKDALVLIPFMIIGLSIGTFISSKTSENIIKRLVMTLLAFSGISLILNNLMLLL